MGVVASTVLSVVGTVASGIAQSGAARQQAEVQRQEAEHAAKQQEFNAQRARTEAEDIARRASDEERAMREKAAQVKGAQRAAAGASGVDVGAGSSLDLLRETAYIEDEDAAAIRFNAMRARGGRFAEAQQSAWNAKATRIGGANAARATTNAGKAALWGSLLKGGSIVADKWDYLVKK
ncbi:virion core protein, T7 gp14 family [Cloacibacillus evryensis]|uniref:virion core protein, T7 gp14 family n=1 Tax=Cloacibacillus evryensis TaxID=508460 RepID=UPI00241CF18B|nr:hypothetical protein [Cloacibacillus evryensis]